MANIDYNSLMSNALQRMVGDVLAQVAETGLPGDHHFYIQFKTGYKGVIVPSHLKAQFPEEMTIVMQAWFDNLGVMDDRFCVTLSFGGKAEDLVIPFAAITGFSDPSVNFSLKFEETEVIGPEDTQVEDNVEDISTKDTKKPEKKQEDRHEGEAEVIRFSDFKRD